MSVDDIVTADTVVGRPPVGDPADVRRAVGQVLAMADLLTPSAVRAAATLGLADSLGERPATPGELAARDGLHPEVLEPLLQFLTELGLLGVDGDGRFSPTAAGSLLRSGHPAGLRDALRGDGLVGRVEHGMVNLVHSVRTGEPAHEATFGRAYWDIVNSDEEFDTVLRQTPLADPAQPLGWDAELLVEGYDWSRARSVVDVGGHTGAVITALLQRHPHLRGTLLDLRNTAEQGRRNLHAAGLADRCDVTVGSFFDPLPPGADVYLLSAVLADWSDEDAVRVLRRCAQAAGRNGRVLLAEVAMPESTPRGELYLRVIMPSPRRSVARLEELAADAGLRVTWRGPGTAVRSVLELTPC